MEGFNVIGGGIIIGPYIVVCVWWYVYTISLHTWGAYLSAILHEKPGGGRGVLHSSPVQGGVVAGLGLGLEEGLAGGA